MSKDSLMYFVALFYVALLLSTGVDNEKALADKQHCFSQGQTMKKLQNWTTEYFVFIFQPDLTQKYHPNMQQNILLHSGMITRVRPRFFDQVGHETINASSGNKHFFTKSCHRQTYQNIRRGDQLLFKNFFENFYF